MSNFVKETEGKSSAKRHDPLASIASMTHKTHSNALKPQKKNPSQRHRFSNKEMTHEDGKSEIGHIIEQSGAVLVYNPSLSESNSIGELGTNLSGQFNDIGYDASANPFKSTEGAEHLFPGLIGYFSLMGVAGGISHSQLMHRKVKKINAFLRNKDNQSSYENVLSPEQKALETHMGEVRTEYRNNRMHAMVTTVTSASIFSSVFVHSMFAINLLALIGAGILHLATTQKEINLTRHKHHRSDERLKQFEKDDLDELQIKDLHVQNNYFLKRKRILKRQRMAETGFTSSAAILLATSSLFSPVFLFAGIAALASTSVLAAYERDLLNRSYNGRSYSNDLLAYGEKYRSTPLNHREVMKNNIYASHMVEVTNDYYHKYLTKGYTESLSSWKSLTLARLSMVAPDFLLDTQTRFFQHRMKRMHKVSYSGIMHERINALRMLEDTPDDILNDSHTRQKLTFNETHHFSLIEEIMQSPHRHHISHIIAKQLLGGGGKQHYTKDENGQRTYKINSEFAACFQGNNINQLLTSFVDKKLAHTREEASETLLEKIKEQLSDNAPVNDKAQEALQSVISTCTDYYLGFTLKDKAHAQRAMWSNLSYQYYEHKEKAADEKKVIGSHTEAYLSKQQVSQRGEHTL